MPTNSSSAGSGFESRGADLILEGTVEELVDHGLWYPPDPSSYEISSIGGNIATNAGGLCCVKYGVTGDYVVSLAVVADGTLVRLGSPTTKDVAGYDLKRLFIGSEGTLGVVTEAVLPLRPLPPTPITVAATFRHAVDAGQAGVAIMSSLRPAGSRAHGPFRCASAWAPARRRLGLHLRKLHRWFCRSHRVRRTVHWSGQHAGHDDALALDPHRCHELTRQATGLHGGEEVRRVVRHPLQFGCAGQRHPA